MNEVNEFAIKEIIVNFDSEVKLNAKNLVKVICKSCKNYGEVKLVIHQIKTGIIWEKASYSIVFDEAIKLVEEKINATTISSCDFN